ncbi:high affinity nitrate transporter 2.7 [Apium graveolens]|uniref:high affinity nitrate transporter 2.7 n=1 Tax=Apium graveolens TaxID=4045 RepID=UPI003D7BE07E
METPNKTEPELVFSVPVDSDNKATELKLLSFSTPHMRAFHLAWLSLFACFFSTFSIPPLLPIIRDELNLTQAHIGHAGIASFTGSIFSRLAMGPACDIFGPRVASATVSLVTAPVVLSMCLVSSPLSFILLRFLIGFSLANFVSSQFWMSSMFSGCTVGVANGLVAGWANVGSGLAQLIMPLIVAIITSLNISSFLAWRVAFIVPATLQAGTAIMVLTLGQDLPEGNYKQFSSRKTNDEKESVFKGLLHGLLNYRGWILALVYAFCFGVEMTTDNIIAQYFYDRFNLDLETAGAVAASFGLANIVSRPAGGVLSDLMGRLFGMRGRLWSLWLVQLVAGLLCVALGRVGSLWGSILTMFGFSLFVQAASGLTFGVVPFVSNRSLGVISGMTGSGGTVGAVVTQLLLFSGSNKFPTQTGISLMGLLMIFSTLPITLIYFPQWGGMFCGPSIPPDDCYQLIA